MPDGSVLQIYKKTGDPAAVASTNEADVVAPMSPIENSIIDVKTNVNDVVRTSRKDSSGNTLSEQQTEYDAAIKAGDTTRQQQIVDESASFASFPENP